PPTYRHFFFSRAGAHRPLHSFPTRRSSDLIPPSAKSIDAARAGGAREGRNSMFSTGWVGCAPPKDDLAHRYFFQLFALRGSLDLDRKSTRLNSSHLVISYAVFCLKKKKKEQ